LNQTTTPLTIRKQPVQEPVIDEAGFRQQLQSCVRGEVCFDAVTRGVYATDASHYQVMPRCVVVPVDEDDAIKAIQIAYEHSVPITARGAGTSLSGQATWTGMVLDVSKYLNKVLSIDPHASTARVQPGLVRDHLNASLKKHGLHFVPDPATTSRATIGGMIGNNSSGTRSILYGKTSDHVVSLKVAMGDGSVWVLGEGREQDPSTPEGRFTQAMGEWLEDHATLIEERFPKVMRRVSGYALDALLEQTKEKRSDPFSLVPLFVGSEGTLGVVVEATIRLQPLPKHTALCIGHFEDAVASLRCVESVVEHGPSAIELLDDVVCAEAMRNPTTKHLADFVELMANGQAPKGMLICEFFGETKQEAFGKAEQLSQQMQTANAGYAWLVRTDPKGIQDVWDVRRLGLGLISNTPGPVKGQAFIEDACVPLKHLADYIAFVFTTCERHGVPLSVYAHASVGVIHCRPMLDLHLVEHVKTMRLIAEACFEKVVSFGGSFSSEHGDGMVRGEFIERFYGPELTTLFAKIKDMLDPSGLMNPGKKVLPESMTEHLRHQTNDYPETTPVSTQFHYEEHGGLLQGAEQCNGVGACRKTGSGTMCPSYMALKDESHSTRGRANALRLALSGQLGGMEAQDALVSDELHGVLDLCLSCKACKTECPNGVDMAKYKAEAQQLRHDRRGVPMKAQLIGRLAELARWGSGPWAPLLNRWAQTGRVRLFMKRFVGLNIDHGLPRLKSKAWPVNGSPGSTKPDVVLFADTYARFFEGSTGLQATALLERLGFVVKVITPGCCQRPALSQGFLKQAKTSGRQTLENLRPWFEQGVPVVVIEPSCLSALVDDLFALIDDPALAKQAREGIALLDQFLLRHVDQSAWQDAVESSGGAVTVHAHCHQKAMGPAGHAPGYAKLLAWSGAQVHVADAGCCGMAGAFGHEHPGVAALVFEDHLSRIGVGSGTSIEGRRVAVSGFSCQMQYGSGQANDAGVIGEHWLSRLVIRPD